MKLLVIDAFADRPFAGNPAAVCFLEEEQDPEWMQAVAAEMNLSETAFVRPLEEGFELRWFTPAIEVELCGHATLASAHALWTEGVVSDTQSIDFHTKSGVLTCTPSNGLIELNFPATPAEKAAPPAELLEALGVQPTFVGKSMFDKFVVVENEEVVRSLTPDFTQLRKIAMRGVMVTSTSDDPQYDFISRYFAPGAGIDEDPVTGSAHCCLGPFWGERLGKTEMAAFQASARGGKVQVRLSGNRVILGGQAVTVVKGELVKEETYRWNVTEAAAGYDLAAEHIHPHYLEIQDVILAALPYDHNDEFTVLDAGGGSGRLVERILDQFPRARGLIIDQSEAFLALAERRLSRFGSRTVCHRSRLQDDWPAFLDTDIHAIVSMSAIHHLDADEKREFYRHAFQSLANGGLFINGDEVRPHDDGVYLSELRDWADHMRRLIAEGVVPDTMHETMNGWIHRNVDCFGQAKQSGDDCHETVEAQLGYLALAGFTDTNTIWQKSLWSVFSGRVHR